MMKNNLKNMFYTIATLFLVNSVAIAQQKNELVTFGAKFLHITFGVFISIIVIYAGLIAYQKFNQPLKAKMFNPREQNRLIASKNLDDAIEHFIKDSE